MVVVLFSCLLILGCQNKNSLSVSEKTSEDKTVLPDKKHLSNKDVIKFLSTDYQIVYRIEDMRTDVQKALFKKIPRSRIANPNEKFNDSDYVEDCNIPQRRLIFAGNSPESCFICYEQGGYVPQINLWIFSVKKNKVRLVFNALIDDSLENVQELKNIVRSGDIYTDADSIDIGINGVYTGFYVHGYCD
jgi:hypothetical protein